MSHRTLHQQSTGRIFRWPIAIGVASIAGLVLGLTGDGLRDVAAWVLVGIAPAVLIVGLLRRSR